jgi:hypothetical protein
METVKVLAFDTGGTILDGHGGLVAVLAECGLRHGVERDWHAFANEHRRRSLQRMLGAFKPSFNMDYVHREVLDALLDEDRGIVFRPRSAGSSPDAGTSSMPGRTSYRGSDGCGGAMPASRSRSSPFPW